MQRWRECHCRNYQDRLCMLLLLLQNRIQAGTGRTCLCPVSWKWRSHPHMECRLLPLVHCSFQLHKQLESHSHLDICCPQDTIYKTTGPLEFDTIQVYSRCMQLTPLHYTPQQDIWLGQQCHPSKSSLRDKARG